MSKPYESAEDTDMVLAVHLVNPAGPDDTEDAVDEFRLALRDTLIAAIERALPGWKVHSSRYWQSGEEFEREKTDDQG